MSELGTSVKCPHCLRVAIVELSESESAQIANCPACNQPLWNLPVGGRVKYESIREIQQATVGPA
jgi:ribosomal protein S27E